MEIEFANGESNVSLFYHFVLKIISLLFLHVRVPLNSDLFFIIMPHLDHLWICVTLALIYSLNLRQHDIVDFFEHYNLLTHNKQSAKEHRKERELICTHTQWVTNEILLYWFSFCTSFTVHSHDMDKRFLYRSKVHKNDTRKTGCALTVLVIKTGD